MDAAEFQSTRQSVLPIMRAMTTQLALALIDLIWNLGMKKFLGIFVMAVALMMGSATVVLADFEAGTKAYFSGDYKTALKEFRSLAKRGDASGQGFLGFMYGLGKGVEQDHKEAVKWYRKAAEQGNVPGQFNLGASYESGQGVARDYKEAAKWYHRSAEKGHAKAQYNLAGC